MQLPNVVECDKWLFEYQLGKHYHAESYDWAPKGMTRKEAMEWFHGAFGNPLINCLCTGPSRIRV